jgi:hypothetical protein
LFHFSKTKLILPDRTRMTQIKRICANSSLTDVEIQPTGAPKNQQKTRLSSHVFTTQ